MGRAHTHSHTRQTYVNQQRTLLYVDVDVVVYTSSMQRACRLALCIYAHGLVATRVLQVGRVRQYVVLVSANNVQDNAGNFDATAAKPVASKQLIQLVLARQHQLKA